MSRDKRTELLETINSTKVRQQLKGKEFQEAVTTVSELLEGLSKAVRTHNKTLLRCIEAKDYEQLSALTGEIHTSLWKAANDYTNQETSLVWYGRETKEAQDWIAQCEEELKQLEGEK